MLNTQTKDYLENNFTSILKQLGEFLAFQSISCDPNHFDDCLACAKWVKKHIESIGFQSEIIPTDSLPLVLAEYNIGAKETVLFYAHYDVQHADPSTWDSDPFKMTIKDDAIYARGACDNKGQVFFILKALEFLINSQQLKYNVKILLEGEEESGSQGIDHSIESLTDKLKADFTIVCDTETMGVNVASVVMGMRGCYHLEFVLEGARQELHSGVHGSLIHNPATFASQLIASIYDENGKIKIPGYYDDIQKISSAELALCNEYPFNPGKYEKDFHIKPTGGELNISPMQKVAFRPLINLSGFHAGYSGPGYKSIVPTKAYVKLTARTVAGQSAEKCMNLLINHLKSQVPDSLTINFFDMVAHGDAVRLKLDCPYIQKAARILEDQYLRKPAFTWEGASLPILEKLLKLTSNSAVLVGFEIPQNNIHGPNEFFSFAQFKRGFNFISNFLSDNNK